MRRSTATPGQSGSDTRRVATDVNTMVVENRSGSSRLGGRAELALTQASLPELVLVTGGTKGIGLACATRFARDGHPLLLSYRRDRSAAEVALRALETGGADVTLVQCDLSEGAQPIVDAVEEIGRAVDFVVFNAAASVFLPLAEIKPHHIAKTLGITIGALIEIVQAVLPRLHAGSGIVTVSGGDSARYIPGHGLLGGAKAALETLTRYLAVELSGRSVRANCVLPGPVDTESARTWASSEWEAFERRAAKATPVGRLGRPEDIAEVVQLLCQPSAAWINGQVIVADGGMFFTDRIFTE
jgi:enoyl-[acyl-carrier protein] reductase III